MKRILLVRHGESLWNAARRLQGQADIGLSERGEAQARALAPLVAAHAPDLVVTSDLKRAVRTAELLGHPQARRQALLREQDVGAWEGMEIADIIERAPRDYAAWRAGQFAPEGAEDWQAFRARVESAVLGVLDDARVRTALLVCHGGVIRAALDALLQLPPQRIVPAAPSSLTILAFANGAARLEAFNATAALSTVDAPE